MRSQKINKLKSLRFFVPNMITLLSFYCGLLSFKFALDSQIEIAVVYIFFATLLDVMDGGVARLLNAHSDIGVQLDSLVDFFNFGIVPIVIVGECFQGYFDRDVIWGVLVLYSMCSVLRLAKFNVSTEYDDDLAWKKLFFIGIPTPLAAAYLLSPVVLVFIDVDLSNLFVLFHVNIALISVCMVANIPTFSSKALTIERCKNSLIFKFILVFLIFLWLDAFWKLLLGGMCLYLLSIPFSCYLYNKELKENTDTSV